MFCIHHSLTLLILFLQPCLPSTSPPLFSTSPSFLPSSSPVHRLHAPKQSPTPVEPPSQSQIHQSALLLQPASSLSIPNPLAKSFKSMAPLMTFFSSPSASQVPPPISTSSTPHPSHKFSPSPLTLPPTSRSTRSEATNPLAKTLLPLSPLIAWSVSSFITSM